jgi:hypothetical protein
VTRVALVYGFWGQNIGNAFFNLGGAHALSEAGAHLSLVQDQPAYATFRDESKGNFENAFDLISSLDVDLVVVQGPVFTPNFGAIWMPTLERLDDAGVSWAGIGVGLRKYNPSELASVAPVLRRFPPKFLATRDRRTYDSLSGLGLPTQLHDGIDSAFYVPRVYSPPAMRHCPELLALAFDHFPEPSILADPSGRFEIGGSNYSLQFAKAGDRAAKWGKAAAVIAQRLARTKPLPDFGSVSVVRPNHRANPHLPSVIYRNANSIASDEPYTYLNIYGNASLTMSDRVHACVATLAYGGSAYLYNPITSRSALFDRVGAEKVQSEPVAVEKGLLDHEFGLLQSFLARHL